MELNDESMKWTLPREGYTNVSVLNCVKYIKNKENLTLCR